MDEYDYDSSNDIESDEDPELINNEQDAGDIDINEINKMGTNYIDSEIAMVDSLNSEQCKQLNILFDRPIRSETIFVLKSMLNSANISEVNGILQLFIKCLSRMNKSANTKSPEILASLGIYLSIILRHDPDLNLYVDGEHFLLTGLKCYLPYMNMYITFFLMATIIKHVNLEVNEKEFAKFKFDNSRQ